MPKILDFIKEKDFTHEEAINILQEYEKSEKGIILKEKIPKKEPEVPDKKVETTPSKEDTVVETDTEDEQELLKVSKDELTELIAKAIEDKFKATRKAPSKGKETDKPLTDKAVVKRSRFEMIV